MLFELSHHLGEFTNLASRQEIDILMLTKQNVKPSVDSLAFAMKIHTLQTYFGNNDDQRDTYSA